MSEEEKKAIEWVKKADWFSARLYAPTILKLIETQQKEIEELHKEINQRIKLKLENERCADEDFIHKDKIKAKIEKLENMYNELTKNPKEHLHSRTEYLIVIGELQSLLKEE